jgi:hypothetical protein
MAASVFLAARVMNIGRLELDKLWADHLQELCSMITTWV